MTRFHVLHAPSILRILAILAFAISAGFGAGWGSALATRRAYAEVLKCERGISECKDALRAADAEVVKFKSDINSITILFDEAMRAKRLCNRGMKSQSVGGNE